MSPPGPHLLAGFDGTALDRATADTLVDPVVAGVSLFRHHNVGGPGEVRALTDALGHLDRTTPLLVAADQETGQLVGLGPATTPFPGAMALAATGDVDLARRVAEAVGTEMRALGATVAYAPVCDLATSPANPGLGIRSFGDDPERVGAFVAATIQGLHDAGVAAVAKHFPGLGDVLADTHHGLGSVPHTRERLDAVELVPFRAALAAGVDAVMTGHLAVPAETGVADLPATLSAEVVGGLLRAHLGFDGLVVTDALDMAALGQGDAGLVDALAALRAGVDLLLAPPDLATTRRLLTVVHQSAGRGLVPAAHGRATARRLAVVHDRIAGGPAAPDLAVVGSPAHQRLAREVADRSITVVRDRAPDGSRRPTTDTRVLVVHPEPADRTPADTSSEVAVDLAAALRHHLPHVDGIRTAPSPTRDEVAAAVSAVDGHDWVVVATMDASHDPAQVALVEAVRATGVPTVTAALRTPWDLPATPDVETHVCTYSLQPPSIAALAAVLVGAQAAPGRLPVRLEVTA